MLFYHLFERFLQGLVIIEPPTRLGRGVGWRLVYLIKLYLVHVCVMLYLNKGLKPSVLYCITFANSDLCMLYQENMHIIRYSMYSGSFRCLARPGNCKTSAHIFSSLIHFFRPRVINLFSMGWYCFITMLVIQSRQHKMMKPEEG